MNQTQEITVCLSGDDRARSYPVTYFGKADFPRWSREDDSGVVGGIPVALVAIETVIDPESAHGEARTFEREALIAKHPDYGWCSVGSEACRDFEPVINDERLQKAI